MKRTLVFVLTLVVFASLLAGCGQTAQTPEPAAPTEAPEAPAATEAAPAATEAAEPEVDLTTKTVGLSMHFMQDDYAAFFVKAFEESMNAEGIKYVVLSADANPEKQLSDITSLMTQKVDALVVVPFDENSIMDKCNEAQAQGIPVISVTVMPQVDAYSTVDGNDYKNAYGATKYMLDKLGGEGEILQVDVPVTPYRIAERMKAFKAALGETKAVLVEEIYSVDQAEIISQVKNAIAAHPNIKGIYGGFGTALAGIGEALKELGRKDIIAVGVDADFSIMNLIKEGYVAAAAAQYPADHAKMASEAAIMALKGEAAPVGFKIPPYTIVDAANVVEMAKTLWDKEL